MTESRLLRHVDSATPVRLDPKSSSVSYYMWWQFGTGTHLSARRGLLRSINLSVSTDNLNTVRIWHIGVQRSPQSVIGRNVTRASDVLNYSSSEILIPPVNGFRDSTKINDDGLHLFISLSILQLGLSASAVLSVYSTNVAVESSSIQYLLQ